MFSTRLPSDLSPNRLTQAVERLRAEGLEILDLTESNPTRAGFAYPPDLLAPLADPRGLMYAPQPFGALAARCAVAADYTRRGAEVEPERIVLTASTSEAYSLVFKVLCDPGDEVLVPRPSYPLLEHLTRLEAVVATPYDLEYDGCWSIDFGSLDRALSDRTRAVLIVSPNNPTGSFVKAEELAHLAALCASRQVALIADEVFADYELKPGVTGAAGRITARQDALVFSLGGLSKSIGLPQAKLAWIAVGGPEPLVRSAIGRLELASDAYLSVSTPVQLATADLLRTGAGVRAQIRARVARNYRQLLECGEHAPVCRVLDAEGGWYAVLQVPSLGSEEDLVLDLLTTHHVLVHPGYFFDFKRESYLIVSLLAPEQTFMQGILRILRHFGCSDWPA